MKKISNIIGGIGFLTTFYSMSCNVEDYPILAIPIFIGLGLIYVSYRIEKGWCDFEDFKDFEEIGSNRNSSDNDCYDDDLVYISYDSLGHSRYMDMR